METLKAISIRASLKTAISSRDIEQDKIIKILDAARLAPSSFNRQPWQLLVIKDKDTINELVDNAFIEVNHAAKRAPVIIIVCAILVDNPITGEKEYNLFDVGLAAENMPLAATDLGLITHPMGGVKADILKKMLGIPNDVIFVIATPIAYPLASSYKEAAQQRLNQRSRRELTDAVYYNIWGQYLT